MRFKAVMVPISISRNKNRRLRRPDEWATMETAAG